MTEMSVAPDWLCWIATLGQNEPRQWPSVMLAYLIAIGLAIVLARLHLRWQVVACVLLGAVAIAVSGHAEQEFGSKDDHAIIIDEYLVFPVATIGLPVARHPVLLSGVLVASWALDGLKPPPARQAQSLAGGWGIVFDDVISNLYALFLAHLGWWVWSRRRQRRSETEQ